MTVRKVFTILLLLALVACTAPGAETETTEWPIVATSDSLLENGPFAVYRVTDKEAGVICWVFVGYYKGGISCLPLGETRLVR